MSVRAETNPDYRQRVPRYLAPLRYPGGKQRLGKFFENVIELNRMESPIYVEPFAGGAGVALHLLYRSLVRGVHLNDVDRSIYAFWYAATRRNADLIRMIRRCRISVSEWDRQREVQRSKAAASLLELGFSTLFLNRTNRSGILRGGIIGGRAQRGQWKIDARFNKHELISRIEAIGKNSRRITLTNYDCRSIDDLCFGTGTSSLVYFDPPYFHQGRHLYVNHFSEEDHSALAKSIARLRGTKWIVTYDNSSETRRLYLRFRVRTFSLAHTAARYRIGSELIVASPYLRLPGSCLNA